MKIRFLGACEEVGRSAFSIEAEGENILLDYGVLMNSGVGFPVHISPKELSAIVISHAHLDHSGLLPLFYISGGVKLYGIEPTFKLCNLLIKDFLNLTGYYLPFEYLDLQSMVKQSIDIPYESQFSFNGVDVTLYNAGHIPGSCQVEIAAEGKKLLYTGDFNTTNTRLLQGAELDYKGLDGIIIESTYANDEHSDRSKLEDEFVAQASEVVEGGGTVLIPAFGVGRSQEVISIFAAHSFKHPVYVDGMALKAIRIFMSHPNSLGDVGLFKRAVKEVEWIEGWKDRRKALKTPSVIVSPAGMLKGGAAIFYMESIAKGRKNAIFLVSYQIPGTPGHILLKNRKFMIRGKAKKVDAKVMQFDFSSHLGKREFQGILSNLDSKTRVFAVHGEEKNCKLLAKKAEEFGLEAIAPKANSQIEF